MTEIHNTAIISEYAEIGKDVKIGPFTIVEDNVKIGDGTHINAHVLIGKNTTVGKDCRIFHSAVVGEIPQDLKFAGEETFTIIGDRTVIREFVTIHRGTDDKWKTVIGSDCLLMAYVHVAHDVEVGNNVILANGATLAGHVTVDDFAIIGGLVGIHQFTKIGCHVMIGGGFRISKDVPPYVRAGGEPLRFSGLNAVGLKRRGFTRNSIKELKDAYNLIFNSNLNVSEAVRELQAKENCDEVKKILEFISKSERGIIR